jgi:hypothetical protein
MRLFVVSSLKINYLVHTLIVLVSLFVMLVLVPRHINYLIQCHQVVLLLPSNLYFQMSRGM